jgi:hypothetical protein
VNVTFCPEYGLQSHGQTKVTSVPMESKYPFEPTIGTAKVPSIKLVTLFAVTEICVILALNGEYWLSKTVKLTYGFPVGKLENEAFVTLRYGSAIVCEVVVSF